MAEDKLNDEERAKVQRASSKVAARGTWALAVTAASIGAGIWFGDWRFAGIGVPAILVAAWHIAVHHVMTGEKYEGQLASYFRVKERAEKAKKDRERRYTEDLERECGIGGV